MLHSVTRSDIISTEISRSVPICRLFPYGHEVQISQAFAKAYNDIINRQLTIKDHELYHGRKEGHLWRI